MSSLPQLTSVDGCGCPGQHSQSLLQLPHLTSLLLNGANGLVDIHPLHSTSSLQWLELSYCRELADISVLVKCHALTSLDISGTSLHDISSLASCSSLTALCTRESQGHSGHKLLILLSSARVTGYFKMYQSSGHKLVILMSSARVIGYFWMYRHSQHHSPVGRMRFLDIT